MMKMMKMRGKMHKFKISNEQKHPYGWIIEDFDEISIYIISNE